MTRPLRADAARNRRELLRAAAEEFREHGIGASIADIARRAGIGKGTVFRHFATKEQLLAAIVIDRLDTLSELGESLAGAADAEAALHEFLAASVEQQQDQNISFLYAASPDVLATADVTRARQRMFDSVYALVERAKRQGAIRADVTGPDVVLLMCAPGHVAEPLAQQSPQLWRRYLAVLLDGLRPEGARDLPHPPPAQPMPV
ncbi:AcrR family transcriptional regulator [Hamadaea flava]|uniref:TetR/AcrR family transcriptional regulator n=1 Tax=Hamadaea flava TaxID=1742688 RepID=A0ABV8LW29_9ACTN|nr:TetR/AcrR family transcriptional regulator [Hamadaea flava]MCP2327556.1 AcrR family transcriptional regulator [Hamadaea flava]